MENKQINTQELNYLNVPLSIINQRWFKSDNAVRAWFFYAWQALLPRREEHRTKTVKGKEFHLTAGEMICTRSYLAKALGITDNAAKGSSDKLKRTEHISIRQEVLSRGSENQKVGKNKVSRVKVNGVPVPKEPYIRVSIPVEVEDMWNTPHLAQIYIYMMCAAYHKENYIVGSGDSVVHVSPGDMLLKHATILEKLKCKEWRMKKNLRRLEKSGAIEKLFRVGNRGFLVHLNYYPKKREKALKNGTDSHIKAVDRSSKTPENGVSSNVPLPSAPSPTPLPSVGTAPSSRPSGAILETPVTDAVKYLFFEKKRNRNTGHLNEIIAYIDENLPEGFPLERLREAMDLYYKEHGDKYIEQKTLLKSIRKYWAQEGARLRESERERWQLEKSLVRIEKNERISLETWSLIVRIFQKGNESLNYVNGLGEQEVYTAYHTLLDANRHGHYVDADMLEKGAAREHPDTWNRKMRRSADYIIEFLSNLGNAGFNALFERERQRVMEAKEKARNEINYQLEKLKCGWTTSLNI